MKHLLQHFKTLTKHPKNAEDLKGLILDLALRGKLTHDFNKERIQSIADKTEGYYELPADWYWDEFDNIVDFQMGKTPPSKRFEFWEGEHPWISIADMDTYKTIYQTKKSLSDLGLKDYFKNGLVKQGTLIMSFKLTIGKTSILGVDACHNEAIISIYPRCEITQDYLFRFLPIISNWGVQVNALMGKTLNKGKIQRLKVPVPPLEEQKVIVEIVNELFKEVEQLEEQTKTRIQLKEDFVTSALQRLTQTENVEQEWQFLQTHFTEFFTEKGNVKQLHDTILLLAVQGKLTTIWRSRHPELVSGSHHASELLKRIQAEKHKLIAQRKIKKEKPLPPIEDHEKPYDLPDGWVWCRLGEAVTYGTKFKAEKTKVEDDTWILELEDVEKSTSKLLKKVRFSERQFKSNKSIFKKGDVIYGKLRPYLDKVIVSDEDGVCTTEMIPISSHANCSPEYLRWYLKNPNFISYANDSTHGMNLPRMGTDKAINAIYALPPLEEQKAIVNQVNRLIVLCDSLEEHIENSQTQIEQLMQSCLKEVFEE